MKDEIKYSYQKLTLALKSLEEGINQAKDRLDSDGVIQRFEFTFELVWKTLKLFLVDEGIITRSPKEVLKETFRYGLIEDEKAFLDMLEDRNQTSHLYSEDITKEIFLRIKNNYLKELKNLNEALSLKIN